MEPRKEKRRRGRPSLATAEAYLGIEGARAAPRSRRHLQNRLYAARVAGWIAADPALAWLHNAGAVRLTAVAEIGRVDAEHGEAAARALARDVCERAGAAGGDRLTTKAAAALIRRWRNERRGRGHAAPTLPAKEALVALLRDTVARYRADHPSVAVEEILGALHQVASLVLVDRTLDRER